MNTDDQTTYDGHIAAVGTPPRSKTRESTEVVVRIPSDRVPRVGDSVRLIVMRPDEEIGRAFREMLLGVTPSELNDLTEAVESAGWPILEDLIREVAR